MASSIKLRASKIEKSFPGVKALDKIDFSVRKGTVHVLCGENGAGKSTLMKIINGLYQPDGGQIFIDERPVKISSPTHAADLGISMIFQELNYVPEMTVEENLFLGVLPADRFGRVKWKEVRREARRLLEAEELTYPPDMQLKYLSVSDIQMLEITKAVSRKAEIIIMDEPTSAITNKEVDKLFSKIFDLKERGVSIIYISHKLDEIFKIADDITIFRDGTVVDSQPKESYDIETVIAKMVGRKLSESFPKEKIQKGEPILEVDNLCSTGMFHDISFHVDRGEIIGFAGLVGAGRTEVMRALFGLDPITSGIVTINGKKTEINKVNDSIENGMVMLSEDRRRYGIIPIRSVKENATLSSLEKFFYGGVLHAKKEEDVVRELFAKMRVKAPTLETTIDSLSGGNQQKVVLAKWMIRNPEVLILDEPTRGIDVGAKYEIYRLMTELVRDGKSVVMVSSELPELIGMCDRIYVMRNGRIAGHLNRDEFSQEQIMKFATGMAQKEVN